MQKGKFKTTKVIEVNYVNNETGEIFDSNIQELRVMVDDKEEYLMIYSSLLAVFMNMEQSEIRVYGYLLRYADARKFAINKSLRVQMSKEINLSERTIYNTIQSLKNKTLLFEDEGLYVLNPRYAFQGKRFDRNKALETVIKLGCKNC